MYETSDHLADIEDERQDAKAEAKNEAIGNLAQECDEFIRALKDANFGYMARNEIAAARAALEKLAAALWCNYNPDLS